MRLCINTLPVHFSLTSNETKCGSIFIETPGIYGIIIYVTVHGIFLLNVMFIFSNPPSSISLVHCMIIHFINACDCTIVTKYCLIFFMWRIHSTHHLFYFWCVLLSFGYVSTVSSSYFLQLAGVQTNMCVIYSIDAQINVCALIVVCRKIRYFYSKMMIKCINHYAPLVLQSRMTWAGRSVRRETSMILCQATDFI